MNCTHDVYMGTTWDSLLCQRLCYGVPTIMAYHFDFTAV